MGNNSKNCPACGESNNPAFSHCHQCGCTLDKLFGKDDQIGEALFLSILSIVENAAEQKAFAELSAEELKDEKFLSELIILLMFVAEIMLLPYFGDNEAQLENTTEGLRKAYLAHSQRCHEEAMEKLGSEPDQKTNELFCLGWLQGRYKKYFALQGKGGAEQAWRMSKEFWLLLKGQEEDSEPKIKAVSIIIGDWAVVVSQLLECYKKAGNPNCEIDKQFEDIKEEKQPMRCGQCNQELNGNGIRFCPQCGKEVARLQLNPKSPAHTGGVRPPHSGMVYPPKTPVSPALSWLNLFLPGLAQIIFGQQGKGIVMLILFFFLGLFFFPIAVIFSWVAIADGYSVANTLQKDRPVGEWQFFPS